MPPPDHADAKQFAARLRGIPLASLSQALSPLATITPRALADAARASLSMGSQPTLDAPATLPDDAPPTLDDASTSTTPTLPDDAPPTLDDPAAASAASASASSSASSAASTLPFTPSEVHLSQVTEAAAAWMDTLPTLAVVDDGAPPRVAPDDAGDGLPPARKLDLAFQGVLGQGGMGVVKEARQCALGRSVAVKLLRPDASDPDKAQALLREALIMGQLEHPNVVPVHALGQLGPHQPALVMKRIEGVSWRALIYDPLHPMWRALSDGDGADGGAPSDRLGFHLSVLAQVCRAVEFAHSRGILHRDIKPENVMVGHYGEVYLVDWGVALHLEERPRLRRPALLGTPAYMAPEMARGDVHLLDARADVYLLGATLYEVLCRKPRHDGEHLLATLYAASVSAPPAFGPDVPPELAKICERATAHDPDARFPDARALREALAAYTRHRSSRALAAEASAHARALRGLLNAGLLTSSARALGADASAPGAQDVEARFSASVFGFQMSLREWPGNAQAAQGLREVVCDMARAELARGDIEYAARLLAQHPDAADDALSAAVRARLDAVRSGRKDLDALIKLRDDHDLSRNQRPRQAFFAFLGVVSAAASLALFVAPQDDATLRPLAFALLAGISLAFGLALWVLRGMLARVAVDRRMAAAVGVFLCSLWAQRLTSWLIGASVATSFIYDAMCGLICTLMAALIARRAAWGAVPFAVAFGLGLLSPSLAPAAFGAATVLCMAAMWLAFRRARREAA